MSAPLVVLDAVVRMRDATPGTDLLDGDGDRWTRTSTGAVFHGPWGAVDWDAEDMDEVDELHGPFRLAGGGAK